MIITRPHLIQEVKTKSDGMGGSLPDTYEKFRVVDGVLDLISGTDRTTIQNAVTEDSTHVLIILDYTKGITDKMRIVDDEGRVYDITYSDNPAGQNSHNELLLSLKQGELFEWSDENG